MENLKSCPFCGSKEIHVTRIYINPISCSSLPDEVNVTCCCCGLGGYTEETAKEAIENWNLRE